MAQRTTHKVPFHQPKSALKVKAYNQNGDNKILLC